MAEMKETSHKFGLEDEEETTTKLITWSTSSTRLLISLRRENDSLFTKEKIRKNVAWARVAEKFNSTSSVKVTGEQCSNKWKKLEDKFKKTQEHNSRTGNDRKECEFQEELTEFFRYDPKVVPTSTVSSMAASGGTDSADSTEEDEPEQLPRKRDQSAKKKKRRRSKSSTSEMIDFLREFKEEKRKEKQEKISIAERMHEEKLSVMNRFIDILAKK